MHRFRSRRSIFRLRVSSLSFLLFLLFTVALPPAAVWGFLFGDARGVKLTLVALPASLVFGILYLIFSANLRCPLCHGPLLSNPRCSRSRKADQLLGSYRLAVATRALLVGHFRCPCCGEPCRCQVSPR